MNKKLALAVLAAGMALAGSAQAQYYGNGGGPAYNSNNYCREFISRSQVGGRTVQTYGNACMMPDGSWQIANEQQGGNVGYGPSAYNQPPVYIQQRPVVFIDDQPRWYRPPPVYYGGYSRGWGHRGWDRDDWGHHDHGYYRGYDHGYDRGYYGGNHVNLSFGF